MITIPTIQQIYNNILAQLQAEFNITPNPFGDAFLVALAGVLSGILWLVYLYIGFTQKNIWPDTADTVANGGTLERFGNSILGRYPFAATMGQYTIIVTGTAGAVIPVTTVYKSDDSSESPGMLYQVTGAYTLTGTNDVVTINALAGGTASRLLLNDTLTATAPIINVNNGVVVVVENIIPKDAETTALYRQNILDKIQLNPGSWSAADYRIVGTEIDGVQQTYAYATDGQSNEVSVFLQGTIPLPSPGPSASAAVVTAYTTALELVRPLGVFLVNYDSCPIVNIDVTIISGSFVPFTPAQQNLITISLTTFINSVHPFIAACDSVANRNDVIATYNLSTNISAAVPGYGFSEATFNVDGTPAVFWQAGGTPDTWGAIPYLNSITFA